MIWLFIFWISFSSRLLLTLIDLFETKNLRSKSALGHSDNDKRLYGINKTRQIPLLAVALISAFGMGGIYIALAPIIAAEAILFAKEARRAEHQISLGIVKYPRLIIIMQMIEVLLVACLFLITSF